MVTDETSILLFVCHQILTSDYSESLGRRQAQDKTAPGSSVQALQISALGSGEASGKREAEPHARLAFGSFAGRLVKGLENSSTLGGRDAGTVVADENLDVSRGFSD